MSSERSDRILADLFTPEEQQSQERQFRLSETLNILLKGCAEVLDKFGELTSFYLADEARIKFEQALCFQERFEYPQYLVISKKMVSIHMEYLVAKSGHVIYIFAESKMVDSDEEPMYSTLDMLSIDTGDEELLVGFGSFAVADDMPSAIVAHLGSPDYHEVILKKYSDRTDSGSNIVEALPIHNLTFADTKLIDDFAVMFEGVVSVAIEDEWEEEG